MEKITSRTGWARRRGIRAKSGTSLGPLVESYLKAAASSGAPAITRLRARRFRKLPAADAKKPLRVLVADDDHRVLDEVGHLLSGAGMVVHTVDNPYDVGPAAGSFKPQVLVVDEYFTDSGLDFRNVISSVARRYPGIGVVVTTGGRSPKRAAAGGPAVWGATEIVSRGKVPDLRQLVDAVERAAKDYGAA